jgi:signal transduction histidine kinase
VTLRPDGGKGSEEPGERVALPGDLLCLATAHELKNDLHALSGVLALIERDDTVPQRARDWAARGRGIADGSASRVRAVAGALVEGTRATVTGGREQVRDVAERAASSVNRRHEAPEGATVRGDGGGASTDRPFLLEIVIMNLLTNALAATPQGRPAPVVAVESGDAGGWEVAVEDWGNGIPDGALRVLAGEAGALTELDFTKAMGRWGMGLLLVRVAVLAGGWRVTAKRRGEYGSVVTVQAGARV